MEKLVGTPCVVEANDDIKNSLKESFNIPLPKQLQKNLYPLTMPEHLNMLEASCRR